MNKLLCIWGAAHVDPSRQVRSHHLHLIFVEVCVVLDYIRQRNCRCALSVGNINGHMRGVILLFFGRPQYHDHRLITTWKQVCNEACLTLKMLTFDPSVTDHRVFREHFWYREIPESNAEWDTVLVKKRRCRGNHNSEVPTFRMF